MSEAPPEEGELDHAQLTPSGSVTGRHIAALNRGREQASCAPQTTSSSDDEAHLTHRSAPATDLVAHRAPTTKPAPSRKRARASTSSIAHSSPKSRTRQSSTKEPKEKSEQLLTCPFIWYAPAQSQECLSSKLTRIRDVKLHLRRKHMRPPYCPRCNTVFKRNAQITADNQLSAHLRCPDLCQIGKAEIPQGITQSEIDAMAKYPKRTADLAAQWNVIWDIIFPNDRDTKPTSPFMSTRLPVDLKPLVAFAQTPKCRRAVKAKLGLQPSDVNRTLQSDEVDCALAIVPTVIEAWQATRTGDNIELSTLPDERVENSIVTPVSTDDVVTASWDPS